MTIQDMPRLHLDEADLQIPHTAWCREHVNYDPERSPLDGCCSDPIDLEFGPIPQGLSDVTAARVNLWVTMAERDREISTDVVWLGFNGSESNDVGIAPWKCRPLAFALLAADAQARGDEESASSFQQMARSAIEQHTGDLIRDRMEVVDRARYSAPYREGMLEAYREAGRLDMVPALLQDMDYVDRFSPDEPPSMNRASVLPTTRTAPDGTVLDLTRPLVDRNGKRWFWAGYSVTGHPLLVAHPDFREYWEVSYIWDKSGPFHQDPSAKPETDNPRFIVQHDEAGAYRVVSVATCRSVDGVRYASFDAAKAERDRLNGATR